MATLETIYHDFLSLTAEEQQKFRDLVRDDDMSDEHWTKVKAELDQRLAAMANGTVETISGEESVIRLRERIRARND